MRKLLCFVALMYFAVACGGVPAPGAPTYPTPQSFPVRPTEERDWRCEPQPYKRPRVESEWGCVEVLLDELGAGGVASVGALAFDTGGTLYAARPAYGTVVALDVRDAPGDARVFAEGLAYPFGLVYYDGALYVTGAGRLYRLRDLDGDGYADEQTVLIDDLPTGGGYWTNSVGVGPDERLYLSQGASCSGDDARSACGMILSYALDGGDPQIIAAGLHNPMDFAWHPVTGDLWAGDARGGAAPDVLSLIVPGEDYSAAEGDAAILFAPGSTPAGMLFYRGDAFPEMQGHLVILTYGSWNLPKPAGYELLTVEFGADGRPTGTVYRVIPDAHTPEPSWWLSETETSFFPEHPVDVAVGPEGYLYVAVQEGLIIRVRPVSSAHRRP